MSPWYEPKEIAKLQNQIKNLEADLKKWKHWWNVEAEKIEKAQTILNKWESGGTDYYQILQQLKETLSPRERLP